MLPNIERLLYDLIVLSQERENAPDWALGLKLAEETGEVASLLLYENGFLQHKEFKEDVMHECADVFNVLSSILAKHYSHLSAGEILERFTKAVDTKGQKYAKILGDTNGD